MDLNKLQILPATVMHKRLRPKINKFSYKVYYLVLPLEKITNNNLKDIAHNKFSFISFHNKDHGFRDATDLRKWAEAIHSAHKVKCPKNFTLICMPRILGYVFNPVSFWLGYNDCGDVETLIYEVNNTFGETHSYLCSKNDEDKNNWLYSKKNLHVSPFFKTEGFYKFRFQVSLGLKMQINYFIENELQLCTNLKGTPMPLTRRNLILNALRTPMLSFKVIFLIHYQAIKLLFKQAKFNSKPSAPKKTSTKNLIFF